MKKSTRPISEDHFNLKEGEAEFILRHLFSNSEDLIYLITLEDRKFVFVNKKFTQTLGYSAEELQNGEYDYMDLISPRSLELVESRNIRRSKGEKVETQIRFWAKGKDGEEVPLHATLIELTWRGKESVLGIARDISLELEQMNHLKETININQVILDNVPTGIILLDPHLKFRYVNPKGEKILGKLNGELLGHSIKEIVPQKEIHDLIDEIARTNFEDIRISPIILTKISPKPLYNQWIFAPVHQMGQVVLIQAIVLDMTETVEKQRELEFKNKKLEEVNLELETLNQRLDEFVAITSHDLKAPVRRIVTFGTMLQNSLQGLNEDQKEQLRLIVDTSRELVSMIDSFVSFSRLDKTTLRMQEFEMEKIIELVMRLRIKDLISEKKAKIVIVRPLSSIIGDYKLFTQVWQNLLQNAIKFSREGIEPRIKIWAEANKERVIFFCKDNGIGIPNNEQETIFEMFKRGSTAKNRGTGIGLSIVKKIVELHGGTISVKNNDGSPGATFYFSVPNPRYLDFNGNPIVTGK